MVFRRVFIPKGAGVLVAEDELQGSAREVIQLVEESGGKPVGVAVIVDRSNGKTDFGIRLESALTLEVISYEETECPVCKEGNIPLKKPGSRAIKLT